MVKLNDQIYSYKINKTKGYVDKKGIVVDGLLRFDLGECDGGPDKRINLDLSSECFKRYPHDYSNLFKLISEKFGIRTEKIIISPGLNEMIERINRVFLNKDDKVLILNPTFFRFEDSVKRQTNNIKHIYLKKESDYSLTREEIKEIEAEKNVKLIWICNPINPTGKVISLENIEKIISNQPKTLIIVDEAYLEYVKNHTKYTALKLINKFSNLIVLRTLSKYHGLAGIRFGYGFASEEIIHALESIQLEFDITGPSLDIIEQFFSLKQPNIGREVLLFNEKNRIEFELKSLKNIEFIPSSTGIILVRHKSKRTYIELVKRNILSSDMNSCRGINNLNYVRLTVQTDKDRNNKLIKAFKEMD